MSPQTVGPTVAEYFAGIGLIRMGLERCGWRVVFANDISERKYLMYKSFFPDAVQHYRVKDIFSIDPSSVPATTLATCSFPCIDLSLAGNMGGIHGEHSSAFWGFIKILKAQGQLAPPLVLVENVPGWLCSNKGADFRVTVEALNDLGYACDVFTMDARRFTPQSRLRVFCVGARFPAGDRSSERVLKRSQSVTSDRPKSLLETHHLEWLHMQIHESSPLRYALS
jgi:DNA (cytosine-5)-methyltransferase 1